MYTITCSAPWTHSFATFAEKFFIGMTMALVGISIVFIVLVLISLFVQLLSRLIGGGSAGKPKGPEQVTPVPEVNVPEENPVARDDQQVIAAVIAAAVAAYTADAAPASSAGFTIRRVRRV
jgi:sodium pump decarboxylase gamma subunit